MENRFTTPPLRGFYDVAKHLVVKHPEHVNARGGRMVSPLGAALYGRHTPVAELLYEHGADVRVRANGGWTLLHLESMAVVVDTVRWLLNHGADTNAQINNGGWTPLHLAVWNGRLEIVQMLLKHHADIHAQNSRGEVALHLAVICDHKSPFHINILQLLLDHGADVNARDSEGSTPLHYSSSTTFYSSLVRGSVEDARMLLEHGANIDAEKQQQGRHSIHGGVGRRASRDGRVSMGPWHHVSMLNIQCFRILYYRFLCTLLLSQ